MVRFIEVHCVEQEIKQREKTIQQRVKISEINFQNVHNVPSRFAIHFCCLFHISRTRQNNFLLFKDLEEEAKVFLCHLLFMFKPAKDKRQQLRRMGKLH